MPSKKLPESNLRINEVYYSKHQFLLTCNDVCASILKEVDRKKLCTYKINFSTEEEGAMFAQVSKDGEGWQQWLIDHGYGMDLYKVYYAHTFYSLVADFCNFIYESICCAATMKVSVAYALLRKPLKDNLAYIEWLYIDHRDMIDKLLYNDPQSLKYDIAEVKKRTESINKSTGLEPFYNFRYSRDDVNSLEHVWNNANHIITTRPDYSKTKQESLNFIFVTGDLLEDLTSYYYSMVPDLLAYATDLICLVFEALIDLNEQTIRANYIVRALRHARAISDECFQEMSNNFRKIKAGIDCPRCKKHIPLNTKNTLSLIDKQFRCNCGYIIRTGFYMFDWEPTDMVR